jgi:hypothetical protein
MAKKRDWKWMAKAFSKNKGALHRQLGVPQGQKIPAKKLAKAAKAKGKLGLRARAARTGAKIAAKHRGRRGR